MSLGRSPMVHFAVVGEMIVKEMRLVGKGSIVAMSQSISRWVKQSGRWGRCVMSPIILRWVISGGSGKESIISEMIVMLWTVGGISLRWLCPLSVTFEMDMVDGIGMSGPMIKCRM